MAIILQIVNMTFGVCFLLTMGNTLYINQSTGNGMNAPNDCTLYGKSLSGTIYNHHLVMSRGFKINQWTWINGYEEQSPPLSFDGCGRGTLPRKFVDIRHYRRGNQINQCLKHCNSSETTSVYLSETRCYCGRDWNGWLPVGNGHHKSCDVFNMKHLKCGKTNDMVCKYNIIQRHSKSVRVGLHVWGRPNERHRNKSKCALIKTFDSHQRLKSSPCSAFHPYLCTGSMKSVNHSNFSNLKTTPRKKAVIVNNTHADRKTESSITLLNDRATIAPLPFVTTSPTPYTYYNQATSDTKVLRSEPRTTTITPIKHSSQRETETNVTNTANNFTPNLVYENITENKETRLSYSSVTASLNPTTHEERETNTETTQNTVQQTSVAEQSTLTGKPSEKLVSISAHNQENYNVVTSTHSETTTLADYISSRSTNDTVMLKTDSGKQTISTIIVIAVCCSIIGVMALYISILCVWTHSERKNIVQCFV